MQPLLDSSDVANSICVVRLIGLHQRQIAAGSSLTVSYVGSRSIHQPLRVEDADIVLPTLTPQGYLWPQSANSARLTGMLDASPLCSGGATPTTTLWRRSSKRE
jgi:hypothetical protein